MSPLVVDKVLSALTKENRAHKVTQDVILKGYRRHKVNGELYPAAVPYHDGEVIGALIEGITTKEMEYLDKFEGDEYKRVSVTVLTGPEKTVTRCFVYEWIDGDDRLLEEDWVLDQAQITRFLATF
ncbi:AIG2-like protein [Cyberlindnera fabianii]|nr:AIG2-like protein [Cyberlindnera fabianii]